MTTYLFRHTTELVRISQREHDTASKKLMMNGPAIEAYFADVARRAYHFDLQSYLKSVKRTFVGVRFDRKTGTANALFGNPPPEVVDAISQSLSKGNNAAAGFASASRQTLVGQNLTPATKAALQELPNDFDVFLIANDVVNKPDIVVKAIIFHECGHSYDQTKQNSLQVPSGAGHALSASLPHPTFQNAHTPEFFGAVATAAPNLVAFDNAFRDEMDVLGHAFQFDYQGNPAAQITDLLKSIAVHHVALQNAPTYYSNGYIPEIDAIYRTQVEPGAFVRVPDRQEPCQANYVRDSLRLTDAAYKKLRKEIDKAAGNAGLRTWHTEGRSPVQARTKSEARAEFNKGGKLPRGAEVTEITP